MLGNKLYYELPHDQLSADCVRANLTRLYFIKPEMGGPPPTSPPTEIQHQRAAHLRHVAISFVFRHACSWD